MKKLFLSIMTASMFFVSCSNDETVVPENNGSENNVEDLVEIKLGAGSRIGSSVTESRAVTAVEKLDNHQVGLFMLDKEGSWNSQETTDDCPVYWNNVLGTFTKDGEFYKVNYEETTTKFYPRKSDVEYDFYAYSPKMDVIPGEDSIKVTYNFTGKEDIIWGRTEQVEDGWNAKYQKDHESVTPNISLNHLLAWFTFTIVPGHEYTKNECEVETLTMSHSNSCTLTIANTDADKAGKLTFDNTSLADFNLIDLSLGYTAEEGGTIGDIFVDPNLSNYNVSIKLSDGTTSTIPLAYSTGTTSIEAGKKYNVNITIDGPTEIKVTATLTEWASGGTLEGGI